MILRFPLPTFSTSSPATSFATGDVLFVGSVSGKTANVVELALQGRAHGLTVIALHRAGVQSRSWPPTIPPASISMRPLTWRWTTARPYGDAMLPVEGLAYPICPASGIGAAVVMWAVMAGIAEEMLARGSMPTVLPQRQPARMARRWLSQAVAEAPAQGVLMDYLDAVIQLAARSAPTPNSEAIEQAAQARRDGDRDRSPDLRLRRRRTPASWRRRFSTGPAVWCRSTRSCPAA